MKTLALLAARPSALLPFLASAQDTAESKAEPQDKLVRHTQVAHSLPDFAIDYTHPENTLPNTGNYIDLAYGYVSVDGNEAAYLARHPNAPRSTGGVERFQYSGYVGRYTEFSVTGRGLPDQNDYRLGVEFTNQDVGYFRFNFQEFRTWYDGSGIYFPRTDVWVEADDDSLALDRSKIQLVGGLTRENLPKLEFSYTRLAREGQKSSGIRGDTSLTGGAGSLNIVPAFYDIDEVRHIFEAEATETYGKTKASLALRSETSEGDNSRKMARRPGEAAFRRLTHTETFDSDLFSARATTITEIGEKTKLTTGAAYTDIDTNATGNRIYAGEFDSPFDVDFPAQNRDHGWINLLSNSQMEQWVLNANLLTAPAKHWKAVYSLRFENMDTAIHNEVTETEYATGPRRFGQEDVLLLARRDWNDAAASAKFTYTGKENAVYSGSVLLSKGDGDLAEDTFEVETGDQLLERLSKYDRDSSKVELSAKFFPSNRFRYFFQVYRKEKKNEFDSIVDTEGPGYPAFTQGQRFTTDDLNASIHWKATDRLSGMTRIDYQISKVDSQGLGLQWAHAYDRKALVFSQAISLSLKSVFLQLSGVYADDARESPVSEIGNVGDSVRVLDGDYFNGNLTASFGINDVSSASLNFFYNRIDTYQDSSAISVPYGEDLEENGATVTYTRKLADNMQLSIRYTYFESEDMAHADFNDYHAQVIYSTLRYRF